MTHYDTLEVSPQASPEVVRAAYRSLIQRFHPDRHPGDAAAAVRAAAITEAYEVLSDAAKRALYDEGLAARVLAMAAPAAAREGRGTRGAAPRAGDARHGGFGAWWLWILLIAGVVWGAVWFAAQKTDPRTELASIHQTFAAGGVAEARLRELYARKERLLQQNPQLRVQAGAEAAADLARRTFDLLDAPLVVPLAQGELTIPRLRIVLGTFDAASLREHIDRHRERLLQEMAQGLARADPALLRGAEGEAYLKSLVAGALGKGLDTRPEEDYPSTYFESPGRHGIVEVLLPDHYALRLS